MSTGFLYYCSRLVSQMALVLGREDDKIQYDKLARETAAAFNRKFLNDEVGAYGNNDESANSFALFLGLVPGEQAPRMLKTL